MSGMFDGGRDLSVSNVVLDGITFCCGQLCAAVVYMMMAAVQVAMIAVGALHIEQCPAQKLIPVYLIVFGSVSLSMTLIRLGRRWKQEDREDGEEQWMLLILVGSMMVFLAGWWIAGCVWVFPIHPPEFSNSTSTQFCHPTAYHFAFVINCVSPVELALALLFGIFLVCCCLYDRFLP